MSTPEEIADCLERAADYIEVHGWHQGALYGGNWQNPTPPACIQGAIRKSNPATDALPLDTFIRTYILPVSLHLGCMDAIGWQDTIGRTEFEVIDALRLTAKSLRPVELPDPHAAAEARDEALSDRYER